MNAKLIRLGRAALCATTLLLAPTTTHATVLVPGGAVMPDVLSGSAGTLVDTLLTPLTLGGNPIGALRAAVVRNGATLDFYYQVFNSGLSGVNLSLISNEAFAIPSSLFVTDVFTRSDTGGLPVFLNNGSGVPTNVTRSGDGILVGFNFVGPRTSAKLNPGEFSQILVVRTNATLYVPGLTTVSNGITTTGPSFAPSAVPEPASLLLLGSAFAAAGYMARHRGKKKPTTTI
jgi:hypothetical protein